MLRAIVTESLLVHYLQSLLLIFQRYVGGSAAIEHAGGEKTLPLFLADMPADLSRAPFADGTASNAAASW